MYSRVAARVRTGVRGCCGTAEGLACHAMPSCAGAYMYGVAGSNTCPAGSVRIEAEAACRIAALAAGKTFSSVVTYSYYPRGCYIWTDDNKAYFNTDSVGAGEASSRLICAALCDGCTAGACPMPREPAPATRGLLGGSRCTLWCPPCPLAGCTCHFGF